jgi:hypothetical protein
VLNGAPVSQSLTVLEALLIWAITKPGLTIVGALLSNGASRVLNGAPVSQSRSGGIFLLSNGASLVLVGILVSQSHTVLEAVDVAPSNSTNLCADLGFH